MAKTKEKSQEVNGVKVYTKGGNGKRECGNPDCPHFLSVRTKICACGYEFSSTDNGEDGTETDPIALIGLANKFIEKAGGADKAKKLISALG